ncbi:hypothetical protein EVAR_13387_1 [Eumeta japonica]|uniref:Uncharacterized protein n=1 Tax=Eumeta variegata TaxID=151549 RepID=A0A4C1TSH5_EUMVA|nr:hypothetical protein EVAR_13387_1 [Eumeta japonica]
MSALMLIRETIAISALFVPSMMCERIGKGRHRVKLQLQHMLFSKALDDKGRRLIHSFIAFIEENDLSVTLLNLFDLNVGLPLNFLALILSYLIVLLQSDHVLGF